MTNFERLKSEIDINDFANSRLSSKYADRGELINDVKTYKISGGEMTHADAEIYAKAFNDELKWLKKKAVEGEEKI